MGKGGEPVKGESATADVVGGEGKILFPAQKEERREREAVIILFALLEEKRALDRD